MRTQIFYSIMGLEPTKGLDIVLDEMNGVFAIQTDNDCRKSNFKNSLFSVNLFFSMFDTLTDYEGTDETGLKKFAVKQFAGNITTPKFYFLFDENNTFAKSRIFHEGVGQYDFEALVPLESKVFEENDWYTASKCREIDDEIIEDSSTFASFMYQLVMSLIGGQDQILEYLGIPSSQVNKFDGHFLEDEEDFAD